jgi:ABC-2 type transport system ATP-binding protein
MSGSNGAGAAEVPAVEVDGLVKRFEKKEVLSGLTFTIRRGEVVGYLGANGAGKTTTLRILAGIFRPDAGTARIAGFDVAKDPIEAKRRIGYVPEAVDVFDWLTSWEYLRLVGRLHGLADKLIDARAKEMLDSLGLLDRAGERLDTYSKGMRKKVALIAALLHDPDVILMDEPLDGLDANSAIIFKSLVRALARSGKAVLYSSHLMDVVERVADRAIVIAKGPSSSGARVVAEGSLDDLRGKSGAPTLEDVFRQLTDPGDLEHLAERLAQATRPPDPSRGGAG